MKTVILKDNGVIKIFQGVSCFGLIAVDNPRAKVILVG